MGEKVDGGSEAIVKRIRTWLEETAEW